MNWTVEFIPQAVRQLRKLDRSTAIRITRYLQDLVQECADPQQRGTGLRANLVGLWRYRVGDLRLICELQDSQQGDAWSS